MKPTTDRALRHARAHGASSWLLLLSNTGLGLVSCYLGLLTVAGWRSRLRGDGITATSQNAHHRFVVLIPAHNEEALIGTTLESLAALDYPPGQYGVHVVADNCTDGTAAVARAHGAEVHERLAPNEPGKGPALSWLLRRLRRRGEPHDAVVILDADSVVAPNFLRVMDARLSQGDRVLQSHYAVRDPGSSWLISMRAAALAVRHYLRPLARTSLGGSAGLYGNGMVFAADVMRGREWSAHLTEDIEFEAELLLEGERVAFAPDAVVEAEMPARLTDAQTQNERWERGRIEVARRYVPMLLFASGSRSGRQRIRCADAAVDHMVPPFSVLTSATAITGLASAVLWLLRPTRLSRLNGGLALGSAGTQSAYLASGLLMVGAPAAVWRALLGAPLFMAWKVSVWLRAALTRGPAQWIRTPRNAGSE